MSIRDLGLTLMTIATLATTALTPENAFAQATSGSPGHGLKRHPLMFSHVHPLNPQPLPPRKIPLGRTAL
jgi:hypothetical protein